MISKEIVKKIVGHLFPEFSNKVTWSVLLVGFGLVSSSLVVEFVRKFITEQFSFDITNGNDTLVGFGLVVVALLHNLGFKAIEASREKIAILDLASNISSVRTLIDSIEKFDEVTESSWWGFIQSNLTEKEVQFLNPIVQRSMADGVSVNPYFDPALEKKKKIQIVSNMLSRLELESK